MASTTTILAVVVGTVIVGKWIWRLALLSLFEQFGPCMWQLALLSLFEQVGLAACTLGSRNAKANLAVVVDISWMHFSPARPCVSHVAARGQPPWLTYGWLMWG